MFGYRHLRGEYSHVFVLGDIPLVTNIPQWVLVHQSNLVETCDFHSVGQRIYYAIMRRIFKQNSGKCTGFFVQSEVMEAALMKHFPTLKGRTHVIPHAIPIKSDGNGMISEKLKKHGTKGRFLLLYPCAGYPHKNHSIVPRITRWAVSKGKKEFVIGLTLADEEVRKIPGMSEALSAKDSVLVNLGRLSYQDVLATLEFCDGIFFPSLLESYGLPLVEAILAIGQAIVRKRANIFPKWSGPMAKIPDNWNVVVGRYLEIMSFGQGKEV
jgi:glycosyltransferase involved in cell wall biosynthesis